MIATTNFNKDNFLFRIATTHSKSSQHTALVIGSHLYYSRTFSDNITKHINMLYADMRMFTPDNPTCALRAIISINKKLLHIYNSCYISMHKELLYL